MKYQPITYKLLKKKKISKDQLDLIEKAFGKENPIPLDNTIFSLNIGWFSKNLLTKKDLVLYKKVETPAWNLFENIRNPILAEYEKTMTPVLNEYNTKLTEKARIKFEKLNTTTEQKYLKRLDTFYKEYKQTICLKFIDLYKKGMQ